LAEGANRGLFFTTVPNGWVGLGGRALNGINAVGLG
jgi:hypothetical protein